MPLTVKNCLNRWCPRSVNSRGAIGFVDLLYRQCGLTPLHWTLLKGRPPLDMACIAPHCHHWEVIDEERGNCLLRALLEIEEVPA